MEYLRALDTVDASMTPFAVERRGAEHDAAEENAMPSAAFLRQRLRRGADAAAWMPGAAWTALLQGPNTPDQHIIETAMLSRLRCAPESAFAQAPDVAEGLENRIYAAARTEPTLEAIVDAAATKRYPRSRVRRIVSAAALGLRREDSAGLPPYLRPLAADRRGLELLRAMEKNAALPVLTKSAHVRRLGADAERVFALGAAAADLYALGYADPELRRGDGDWRAFPALIMDAEHLQ